MNNYQSLVDSRKKFILLILILGSITAIGPLTIDMYLPAFAAISKSFAAPENLVQLSLSTYFVGLAFGQLLYGPIIDRYGKKIPLYFGLSLFLIATTACYFSSNIYEFIFLRFFQAIGACIGIIAPRAIVRDIFSPQESAKVFSHLMLVMGLAPILAPLFGSFILAIFGWKEIFAFLVLFGVFCLIVCHYQIPQTSLPNKEEKISQTFKKYREILQDRTFVVSALCGSFAMSGLFVYITASPFAYLEFFHISAKKYGLIFAVNSIGFVTFSQLNAFLLRKISLNNILDKLLLIPLFSGLALIFIGTQYAEFLPFTITFFIFIASIGSIVPNTTALALSKQFKHSGSASALLGTIQFSFATLISFLVSNLHEEGVASMSIVSASCGILSFLIYRIFGNYLKKDNQTLS